ncbi:hypothetical protein [Larkinella sp. C7]|uniref:hypothetical protein n=1 Tax=Larkinella sp. C7 TaxID=2576607 RepID=UPI0011110155|nr:hypothetical protein [Larkinella sp. C7]
MTLDEFRALDLDSSSHYVTIQLKGDQPPVKPAKLHDPLPTATRPILFYTYLEGKRRFFSIIPYDFTGAITYYSRHIPLEEIESITELPLIVRNKLHSDGKRY